MSNGVASGDGLGPLFFSLGLDDFLTAVREAMRDLNVDSTMFGQVWFTQWGAPMGDSIPAHTFLSQTTSPSLWLRHRHTPKSTRSRKMHEERCRYRSVLVHGSSAAC